MRICQRGVCTPRPQRIFFFFLVFFPTVRRVRYISGDYTDPPNSTLVTDPGDPRGNFRLDPLGNRPEVHLFRVIRRSKCFHSHIFFSPNSFFFIQLVFLIISPRLLLNVMK